MKMVGDAWKLVTEKEKKTFEDKAEAAKELRNKQLSERETKGYFTFPDGTKSTDLVNKNKVQKVKPEEETKENKKSKIQKAVEGVEDDDEEVVVKPPRAKGAYNYYMAD